MENIKNVDRILLIDDEDDILDLLTFNLKRANYEVIRAKDGNSGLEAMVKHLPNLVVLDLMLPGLDGYGVFQEMRSDARLRNIPVIMLTAKAELVDRIAGLKLGADDYLTKPFSPRELVLRVQALLRRIKKSRAGAKIIAGPFHIDKSTHKCFVNGKELGLTATELKLLSILLENEGSTVDRSTLLRDVWGYTDRINTRTLDTHLKRLREKLGNKALCVKTVRGQGYRIVLEKQLTP